MAVLPLLAATLSWAGGPTAASRVAPRAVRGGAQIRLAEAAFQYKREGDIITFGASQSFLVPVKPEAKSVREYVASGSKRLILASWDPSQIEELEDPNTYRIKFQKLDFLVLKITPEVDCKLLQREDAAAFISTGWRIPGLEEHVSLDSYKIKVRGEVRTSPPHATMTSFRAKIEFEVEGKVPQILAAVPEAASSMAAEQLSRALLGGAQKRFCETLPRDYREWSKE
ncbi:hypothetical protein KFE25_008980 [Diacronema lutheri]|uniref:START domain-containing protein n=1 Tax=Diacronema lutheri TaxID=2081491 RepID=A0A8J6CFC4_DIALT|nr:hypothetical protein KFE25_008980 [Diacronema lutheri]